MTSVASSPKRFAPRNSDEVDLSDIEPKPAVAVSRQEPAAPVRRLRRKAETKSKNIQMRITPSLLDRFVTYCDTTGCESYVEGLERLLDAWDSRGGEKED